MKQILIIFGGTSSEHDVSIQSAKSVYEHIDREQFDVSLVYIAKNNLWYKFDGNFKKLTEPNWIQDHEENNIFNIIKFLSYFDVVFPVLHGKNGEDGTLQGMLELFHIPYIGCNHVTSAIAMDKVFSKILLENSGIPILPYVYINAKNYTIEDVIYKLDFPMIIKPATGGSSIGINIANNVAELDEKIQEASNYDSKILIEPFIKAQELECAVLEKEALIASTIGEIIPANQFYDYQAKYESKESITLIPANIPNIVSSEIKTYSKKIFQLLNCKDLARIDFFYNNKTQQIYFNEINTLPGFTTISMYPKLLESNGISYKNLLTTLITNHLH